MGECSDSHSKIPTAAPGRFPINPCTFCRNIMSAFTMKAWWIYDKMQIIFKAITGSSGHAFWWERAVLHSMKTFDAGLVALESISPTKCIHYGTLRCRTLPSKENYPRQRLAPWFLRHIFLLPVQCRLPTKGCDWNFLLSLWILSKFHDTSNVKASIE